MDNVIDAKERLSVDDLKRLELEILLFVKKVCTSNHLTYYLAYGTLLGAVRHKGFIPWDDDIDIWMPRDDYNKFVDIISRTAGKYKVVNSTQTSGYGCFFGKIIDTQTRLVEDNYAGEFEMGVYVDVFPLDNQGNTKNDAKKLMNRMKFFNMMREYRLRKKFPARKRSVHRYVLYYLSKLFPLYFWIREGEKTAQKYNGISSTNYFGCNVDPVYHRVTLRDDWQGTTCVEFEGHLFSVPEKWDLILRDLYGDYMALPPPEKRTSHHQFSAWQITK